MKCVVRRLVEYWCVVEAPTQDDAVHVAAGLPERAWQETGLGFCELDEERNEKLRNWEFPHTHTWRCNAKGPYAVDATGTEIDREPNERQKHLKQRVAEREKLRNKEAA
jgi:hypothetical protein